MNEEWWFNLLPDKRLDLTRLGSLVESSHGLRKSCAPRQAEQPEAFSVLD